MEALGSKVDVSPDNPPQAWTARRNFKLMSSMGLEYGYVVSRKVHCCLPVRLFFSWYTAHVRRGLGLFVCVFCRSYREVQLSAAKRD